MIKTKSYYVAGDTSKIVIDSNDDTTVIYFRTIDKPVRDIIVDTFANDYNVRDGVASDIGYRIDKYYRSNTIPFELEINGSLSDQ